MNLNILTLTKLIFQSTSLTLSEKANLVAKAPTLSREKLQEIVNVLMKEREMLNTINKSHTSYEN